MIQALLIFTILGQAPQAPKSKMPDSALILEVDRATISLNFHKVKIEHIEDVTDCVYIAWRRGRISHRAAIEALARLACVDDARVKGRPLSFHGDSWVSTGHWSKVLKDVIYIYSQGTKTPGLSDYDRFMSGFVEKGLAHRVSNKYGDLIEFEKKPLSKKQRIQLIQWVQELEDSINQDIRFGDKEPLDTSQSPGDCSGSVAIRQFP